MPTNEDILRALAMSSPGMVPPGSMDPTMTPEQMRALMQQSQQMNQMAPNLFMQQMGLQAPLYSRGPGAP